MNGIDVHINRMQILTNLTVQRPIKRGPTPPRTIDDRLKPHLKEDAMMIIHQSQQHYQESSSAIHHIINREIQSIRRRLKALNEIHPKTTTHEALCFLLGDTTAQMYRSYLRNRRTVFKVSHVTQSVHNLQSIQN